MSDKNLGDALLNFSLSPATLPTPAQIEAVIETDRRRIRLLTRWTVALWIAALVGVAAIFVGSGFVFPMLAKLMHESDQPGLDGPTTPLTLLAKFMMMCIVVGSWSFTLLVAAGLTTAYLVVRSRRATLYQINANLLVISEQLKTLRPA